MLNTILVGYGYWGTILLNKIQNNHNFNLIGIVETHTKIPDGINLFSTITEACQSNSVDCVIIATPASTHKSMLLEAMNNKLHIWVEKPLVNNVKDFKEIKEKIINYDKLVWVDHTFLQTSGFKKLKKELLSDLLGKVYKIDSIRTDFGLFQKDASIFTHLMYHDFYIVNDIIKVIFNKTIKTYKGLKIISNSQVYENIPDSAVVSFNIDDVNINIKCDMGFAKKNRYFQIWGEKGLLVWDETQNDKLCFYPISYEIDNQAIIYNINNRQKIMVDNTDALNSMLNKFKDKVISFENNNLDNIEDIMSLCFQCDEFNE